MGREFNALAAWPMHRSIRPRQSSQVSPPVMPAIVWKEARIDTRRPLEGHLG